MTSDVDKRIPIAVGVLSKGVCTAVLVMASACSADRPVGAGSGAVAKATDPGISSMPAIYVDSRLEFTMRGKNFVRDNYEASLDACRESGLPLRELSEEEVAKLGTGRLQRWYRADSFAYRLEEWRFHAESDDRSGLCQFALFTDGVHHYITPDSHQAMDLATGKAFSAPEQYRDYFPRRPVVYASDSEILHQQATSASRAPARDRLVAGQQCEHYTIEWVEACDWSGGGKWGFENSYTGLLTDNARNMFRSITLEQEPSTAHGFRLTTQTFQIEADFEVSEMIPGPAP